METVSFKNITGHRHIIEFLTNILNYGQIGHSYLFYGTEGVGKETIAKRFAMALLCEKRNPDGDACEKCDSCHRFQVDSHPNFLYLEPEGRFNYKIDQIRDLRKNVSLMAYQGDRRVYLIPDADKMQPEGANAILKTLEEPGPGVILILISSNLLRLLPTIISRCQQVRFGRLTQKEIQEILIQKMNVPEETANLVSNLADGSAGKALALSDPSIFEFRKNILTSLSNHSPGNLSNCFEIPKKIMDSRKTLDMETENDMDIVTIYDWLIFWFHDLFVYRITKENQFLIHSDFKTEIAAISNKWTWSSLRATLQHLEYLKYIAQKNINPQYTLETVFLRAYQTVTS